MASRLSIAFQSFRRRPWWRKLFDFILVAFALAGASIIGAWGIYELGLTNNSGAVDKNYRYLASVADLPPAADSSRVDAQWAEQLGNLAAFARLYPDNAHLILQAASQIDDPSLIGRMIAATLPYTESDSALQSLNASIAEALQAVPQRQGVLAVRWMREPEWAALKEAIAADSLLIREAGRLTGVEPRLIVGCLVGEQIRLFNSKREMYKQYLGPMKVLSVQSQFSYGVNGIKDFTAEAVEQHLKDSNSVYYMGPEFENLLDFSTSDHATERYNRLVDYRSHLYSYIYTGCILHQTMLQWQRAGYDISNRPDVLFTLFNVGFDQSHPKPDPMPGGSHITIGDSVYTFGAIGFDFYYSGELVRIFPITAQHFHRAPRALTSWEITQLQEGVSDCSRPGLGSEYRQSSAPDPSATAPDPFGIDHDAVTPTAHTAQ